MKRELDRVGSRYSPQVHQHLCQHFSYHPPFCAGLSRGFGDRRSCVRYQCASPTFLTAANGQKFRLYLALYRLPRAVYSMGYGAMNVPSTDGHHAIHYPSAQPCLSRIGIRRIARASPGWLLSCSTTPCPGSCQLRRIIRPVGALKKKLELCPSGHFRWRTDFQR